MKTLKNILPIVCPGVKVGETGLAWGRNYDKEMSKGMDLFVK